ncbi:MATE family efflux transporter [Lachnospiraceae bacterium OttesenSCG-928-E19]|nr:MATE family efflux transporter [Lachnospiraceae bacterium OttesenSCG-928-E19]
MKVKKDRSAYLFSNKQLMALIIPLIIEQTLAVCVGMVDSIMIASVGEAAVSGVSLVDNIMILLINAFAALGTGGAVVAGQYLGQKRQEEGCKSATQLVWFMGIAALVITLFVYMGKSLILHKVFGQIEADVMGHANTYLLIVTASIPFMAIYNGGAAIFRAMGNSAMTMGISFVMNIVNVAGNAMCIYGLKMGTAGVAIPTLVSRIVAAVLIIIPLCNQKRLLHIKKSLRYRFDWSRVKKILSIGVPNGLENSMFQLGKIMVLSLVSTFGTYAIAANAVSSAVALFQILPGMAISLAVTAVIARCVGVGDYEQVEYYTKKLCGICYAGLVIMNGVVFLALPLIMKAYHLSARTAHVTEEIVLFHGVACMIIWPISFILPGTFRAAGDAKTCMVISIISMWVFRIGFSYLLGGYFNLGVMGIWIAMVIDWGVRSICFLVRYRSGKWKNAAIV